MKVYTCTPLECQMLDAMVTPFWLRPKHYIDDPYEFYHVSISMFSPIRNGLVCRNVTIYHPTHRVLMTGAS